jgi:predicted nicotinamide N-methyase
MLRRVPLDADRLGLVPRVVEIAGVQLDTLQPRESEALIDEAAFEQEEFLPYWAEPWPSGMALSRVVAALPLRGTRVLELGCGLALPSLVASVGGASVLATDWSPDAIELARANATRNGLALETAVVAWERPERLVRRAPWDVVLAADVLYERRNVDALLELLPALVDATGRVLLADPGRPPTADFLRRAEDDGWRVETVSAEKPRITVHRLWRADALPEAPAAVDSPGHEVAP